MTERLALFIPSLRGGGAERVFLLLAQGFTEHGIQVDFLAAEATGPFVEHIPPGVRLIDLGCPRTITALPKLAGYLRRERPEVLISGMHHANVVAALARKVSRSPVRLVWTVHNPPAYAAQHAKTWRSRYAVLFLARHLISETHRVVTVSKGIAGELAPILRVPVERFRPIYNPVAVDDIARQAQETPDHPFFAPGEPPVVLAVGRLQPVKNFGLLIEAARRLQAMTPCRLLILGEGPERPQLEAQLRAAGMDPKLSLPGFSPNPFACMARAGVQVVSSAWEGFGNVIVEALACGTPVVSTNCPYGPAEILGDGEWGRLVPPDDPEAMARACRETLAEPPQPDRCRQRAAAFSLDNVIHEYLAVVTDD